MEQIPSEVIQDILQYMNPDRIHNLASYSTEARHVVNGMDKCKYIERWLGLMETWLGSVYHKSTYTVNISDIFNISDMGIFLENNWYFKLVFNIDTYGILINYIDNKNNDNDKGWWDKRLYIILDYTINITDISCLSGVHSLSMSNCSNFIDLSCLGSVYNLCIGYFNNNILNLASLGSVYRLYLSGNNNIDISSLGGIHTLILSSCFNVHDVSGVSGVHTLSLYSCTSISDVSRLCNVNTLTLYQCYNINGVGTLGSVHNLYMIGCSNMAGGYSYLTGCSKFKFNLKE